jgi:hypothetical protein
MYACRHKMISHERTPVVSVVHNAAETTPGVTVAFACDERHSGETRIDEETGVRLAPLPPFLNAWWCGGCRALHYVGDGGDLLGACIVCGDRRPVEMT